MWPRGFCPRRCARTSTAIYAYCRVSDDLGDEVGDRGAALALLDLWGRELDACYEGRARHPVFVALAETIRACSIPKEPFADLLTAFRQDQTVTRYAHHATTCWPTAATRPIRWAAWCSMPAARRTRRNSGSPTRPAPRCNWPTSGRMCASTTPRAASICRRTTCERFGVSDETIADGIATPEFRALLRYEVDYARGLFEEGLPLIGMVNRDLALDLDLFSRGGLEILRAIERQDYDVLSARPAISKSTKLALALRAVSGKLLPFLRLGRHDRAGKAA